MAEAANPFSILTKSTLVLRDLGRLAAAARRTSVRCNISIGTLDRAVWRLTEPGTPPPERRVDAVRRLNDAGIPCGVLVAPVLPGLSDTPEQVREVVEACRDAGAISVTPVALHLRPGVKEHYLTWLASVRPELARLYRERFAGRSYQPKGVQARLANLCAQVLEEGRGATGHPGTSLRAGSPGAILVPPVPRRPEPAPRTSGAGEQLHLL